MIGPRPRVPVRTPLDALVGWVRAEVPEACLEPAPADPARPDPVVTGLTLDSRAVRPGDLYAAPAGTRTHGARFAAAAVADGAVAVLTDPEGVALCRDAGVDVPLVVVPAPRAVLGVLAARVYGGPPDRAAAGSGLRLLAVTGTQGKTTVTRLAEGALQDAGVSAAVIGTVGTRIAGEDVRSALTTPEAPDLHALFAVMRESGVEACAMEVSSHALVMGRVDGVRFDVAAFTNLGRDHLDFHRDLEDYYAAKAQLFTPERTRLALVDLDDDHGRRLAGDVAAAGVPLRTYSMAGADADWRVSGVAPSGTGSAFTVHGPGGSWPAEVAIPGDFNVSNALCAVAGLVELGYDPVAVTTAVGRVAGVPGRLEPVRAGQEYLAVVDYAHKPDALAAVLKTLRGRTPGSLVVVLGAGGDRDRGKRPLMGDVAGRLADVLVVTDDNPRSEDPAAIRAEVLAGARGTHAQLHEVGDRAAAVALAAALARPGDTVAVLGKGHETGQEVGEVVHPFDDRVALREAILAAPAGRLPLEGARRAGGRPGEQH